MGKECNNNTINTNVGSPSFSSIDELWFSFMRIYGFLKQSDDGPCSDFSAKDVQMYKEILSILDKIFRTRRLLIDHLRVLRFYGQKGMPPRLYVAKEARAHTLWVRGLEVLEPVMVDAGYLKDELQVKWEQAEREFGHLCGGDGAQQRIGAHSEGASLAEIIAQEYASIQQECVITSGEAGRGMNDTI